MPAPASGVRRDKKNALPTIGDVFGRWTVQNTPFKRAGYWLVACRCACGVQRAVHERNLHDGRSAGCGACGTRLGNRTHGESKTRLYTTWASMRQRCQDPSTTPYDYYGGRGITVCVEWQNYESFRDWARGSGYTDTLTLDRIDTDGNYEPANCRWVSQEEQARNTRSNRVVAAFGESKCVAAWAEDERCGVKYGTLWARIQRGKMPPEEAITRPP